jgi:hypothetical protein
VLSETSAQRVLETVESLEKSPDILAIMDIARGRA